VKFSRHHVAELKHSLGLSTELPSLQWLQARQDPSSPFVLVFWMGPVIHEGEEKERR